jgi:thiosulfate/3-mercaptopyruvate sulfurtransferase
VTPSPLEIPSPLVTTEWLAGHLGDPRWVVMDVRWYLQGKRGVDAYRQGHIPTALFVDVDRDLASPPGPSRPGRHPLPSADAFADFLARAGVGPTDKVVAYDDGGGATAARLWWLLRYFGHGGGRVLDGGIQAWSAAGQALETREQVRPPAERMNLAPRANMVIDKARVHELSVRSQGVLLDARASERFEGTVEPVDARPGHIPGARSAPFVANLVAPGGKFLPAEALAARYVALGVGDKTPVVAYCGSGVTACHDLLALSLAGRDDALLYEGSWSEWAADLALPAAVGKG